MFLLQFRSSIIPLLEPGIKECEKVNFLFINAINLMGSKVNDLIKPNDYKITLPNLLHHLSYFSRLKKSKIILLFMHQ